ncbi:MAG: phosphate acetyltransferase [Coriobacteriales bacterium]|jgi:phosphate acetyltransferase|nr:phosphate acetyltransferase [Coriobacteriales bacterium]
MSSFLDRIVERAAANTQTIVLPEGSDERTFEAAAKAAKLGIANIIVLADEAAVAAAEAAGVELQGITCVDPATSPDAERFADKLFELRKEKGMTLEQAQELIKNELYYGVMMVSLGEADGMVAGAANATSDVLRPCLQILKTAPGTKLVSAFFVIVVPDCEYGKDGAFIFADSGLVQHPDAEELSEIALSSATSFESLLEDTPVVAMLSHSTYGSAKSPSIDKVAEATRLAKEKNPNLSLDGEMQLDAAVVPSVGQSKAPGSTVAGYANVLVFPDLDSGNIGYKLAQRLAKAEAYGPITQGLAKPVNDLSRGCSADDIVGVVAITAVQSQARKAAL